MNPYKPSEAEKREARDDKFIEKDLFNLKIVYDFKMLRPRMTAFVLQSVTPAGEEKIKERWRPEWTKAINEDDIIGMVKLIITCHRSAGKASLLWSINEAVKEAENGMVVGQQKLKWLELQYNSYTKMKLRKELRWKIRVMSTTWSGDVNPRQFQTRQTSQAYS